MNFPTFDAKFFSAPAIQGATFGATLSAFSNWAPYLWQGADAQPDPIQSKVSSISQQSLFSGALAGAITEELAINTGFVVEHGVPKLWNAAVKIYELSKNTLKLVGIGTTYMAISKVEELYLGEKITIPSNTEQVLQTGFNLLGSYVLDFLNLIPITQDLVEPTRGIAQNISTLAGPFFQQIEIEPAKLSIVLGGFFFTQLYIRKYQESFDLLKNRVISNLQEAVNPYLSEIIPAMKLATSLYLSIAIEKHLGPKKSFLAAAVGIPSLYIAREVITQKNSLNTLWIAGKTLKEFANPLLTFSIFPKHQNIVPLKTYSYEDLEIEDSTLNESISKETVLTEEEQTIISKLVEEEIVSTHVETPLETALTSIHTTAQKSLIIANEFFKALPSKIHNLCEQIYFLALQLFKSLRIPEKTT